MDKLGLLVGLFGATVVGAIALAIIVKTLEIIIDKGIAEYETSRRRAK